MTLLKKKNASSCALWNSQDYKSNAWRTQSNKARKPVLIKVTNLIISLQCPHKARPSQELCSLNLQVWKKHLLQLTGCRWVPSHLTAWTWVLPTLHPLPCNFPLEFSAGCNLWCGSEWFPYNRSGEQGSFPVSRHSSVRYKAHKALERWRTDTFIFMFALKKSSLI